MPCHEMAGTDTRVRAVEQNPVGTNRLVPVVLNNRRLAEKPRESQG